MKVLVSYGYYADILDCPTYIGEQIKELQRKFDEWLIDPNNNHDLWFHDEIEGDCISFDAQDFADWINQYYLKESIDKVTRTAIQIRPTKEEKELPIIYI